ncbi:hypothetical protein JOA65_004516 [Escherichia coli]|nr:hypothetical protein [Escherichia coli]
MSHSTKGPINYLKMVSIMFIAFFVTMIITCIIVFAIIYFPYKKVADLLGNFIHLRTMFAGVFFVIAGLIAISISDTATNDMVVFLPDSRVVGKVAIGFGVICIIASFFINHLFGSEEMNQSKTQ